MMRNKHFGDTVLEQAIHFYRVCPIHLDELREDEFDDLACPHGHTVSTWVTMGSDGTIVGQAYRYREAMIVGRVATTKKERKRE